MPPGATSRRSFPVCSQPRAQADKHSQQLWPSGSSSSSSSSAHPASTASTADSRPPAPSPRLSPAQSFSHLAGPSDQATPRASTQPNPFDNPALARTAGALDPYAPKRAVSPALSTTGSVGFGTGGTGGAGGPAPLNTNGAAGQGQAGLASGLRTPTSHGFVPLPRTPGAGQPTTGLTVGDQVGPTAGIGFGLHEPAKMRKAMNKGDGASTPVPGQSGQAPSAAAVSAALDSASAHQGQSPHGHGHAHAMRGLLTVKLISARGLAVSHAESSSPEPYAVMQFEQNEYVSRPPHPAANTGGSIPFEKGQAQPMIPGNLTRSTSGLGVGAITRAFADAMSRGRGSGGQSGAQTPKGEEGSWLGKPGPGDPVWKEEVSL